MTNAIITITGFHYDIGDGKTPDGREVKVLLFKDAQTNIQVTFVMTPEEAEKLGSDLTESKIVLAHELPK